MQNLKYMYLLYNWRGDIISETNLIEILKTRINKLQSWKADMVAASLLKSHFVFPNRYQKEVV